MYVKIFHFRFQFTCGPPAQLRGEDDTDGQRFVL